jgi:hypothetical protein
MDEISFKKGAEGYVAEYTSEGRTMVQIQGVKSGRLSISRFIDTMEPVAMDTVNFTNSVIEINVPAGMKVRLLSDVEIKAVKALVISDTAAAGGGGGGESYVLPKASDSALGGIQTGFSESGKSYAVRVDGAGKAYVTVNWIDTTYTNATTAKPGIVKQGAHVTDATGSEDAHTVLNKLIDELEKAGVLASA